MSVPRPLSPSRTNYLRRVSYIYLCFVPVPNVKKIPYASLRLFCALSLMDMTNENTIKMRGQAEGTPVPLDGGRVDVGPWRIETVEGERKTAEVRQEKTSPQQKNCILYSSRFMRHSDIFFSCRLLPSVRVFKRGGV